jgi:hypothetical protein
MWRVSKGDHELWILGTLEPLPKEMIWRSRAVEARIASSQVVLSRPQVTANVGFFRGLTLLPALLRARQSPGGQTLKQVLPHDLYIRWLALRVKYLGGSDDEHRRPMLAALDLYLHALEQSGLTSDDGVWKIIEATARRHRIPIEDITLQLPVDHPKETIQEFADISRDAEVGCLQSIIERLETDLQPMRKRANLWSLGDIDSLRSMHYSDERIACLNALFSVPRLKAAADTAFARLVDTWVAAAEAALDKNTSSFAVLPITELLKPDGWLAKLRDRGYQIQEP